VHRLRATLRIAVGLASLTASVLLVASALGLLPDPTTAVLEGRKSLSEAVAIDCCLAAERGDLRTIESSLRAIAARHPDLLSAALRSAHGEMLVEVGQHDNLWVDRPDRLSTPTQMYLPITAAGAPWGTVELRFRPLATGTGLSAYITPAVRFTVFVTLAGFLLHFYYLRRVLQHLNPSKVIPQRVRATLDTLAEGLVVLDQEQRIVFANQAFAQSVGKPAVEIQGHRASDFPWLAQDAPDADFPWVRALSDGKVETGRFLKLHNQDSGERIFKVNSAPVLAENGRSMGALASFDDVTVLEQRNAKLHEMLDKLRQSQDQIRQQNEDLRLLATTDSLTSCLNRREFFARFEHEIETAQQAGHPVGCVLADVDFFKAVNDNHGHKVGDQVLQHVAKILRQAVEGRGLVCRYGGEEFAIAAPGLDALETAELADVARRTLEGSPCSGLKVTASFGVAAAMGAASPQLLLEQADRALYFSKHSGRNRVSRWDEVPADTEFQHVTQKPSPADRQTPPVPIPFHAVTALISALHYRDPDTAEHSRRVADLCVAASSGLLNERDRYTLEVAALLHDIGKLGVPDAILLKAAPLTAEERKIIETHNAIGVEILATAFASSELTAIVRAHHTWFAPERPEPDMPTGDQLPLGGRLLAIADAYDAMVSDRVYRKGRSRDAAFAELRRWAGKQFDPKLVEHFIAAVLSSDQTRDPSPRISKDAALRIGVQLEKLVCALNSGDVASMESMASLVATAAADEGAAEIARRAAELEQAAAEDPDWMKILRLTIDLLELCRTTQRGHLAGEAKSETRTHSPA